VSSSLSGIAVEKRRQVAATLGLFAMLFIAVGAVAATGPGTAVIHAFVIVSLLVALLLALLAWGVLQSVRNDVAESRLDAVIEDAVKAQGGSMCDCGHEHDPTELHVPDDPCERDGHGDGCTHSCDTCVLAMMRKATREPEPAVAAARPSPRPRPDESGRRPSPGPRG
jgi:hypothetical protein